MKKYFYYLVVLTAVFTTTHLKASGVAIELDTKVTMDSFSYTDDARIDVSDINFGGNSTVSSDNPEILVDPLDSLVRLQSNFDIAHLEELDSDSDGYMDFSELLLNSPVDNPDLPEKVEVDLSYLIFSNESSSNSEESTSDSEPESVDTSYLTIVNDDSNNKSWEIVNLTAVQSNVEPEYGLQATPRSIDENIFLHWIPQVTGDIYFEARVVGDDCCAINAFINEQGYGGIPLDSKDGWVKFQLQTGDAFTGNSFITSFGLSISSESETTGVVQIRRLFASKVANDNDQDGLPDRDELFFGLDPNTSFLRDENGEFIKDEDGNYLPDLSVDANADFDGDGLTNIEEFGSDSNWVVADTDFDEVPDAEDDLPSDPNETVDTDNDGRGNNSDPDDDNDRIPDEVEEQYSFLDPLDSRDGSEDRDQDGISNSMEYQNGTSMTFDDYGPVISGVPNVLRVKATGDFTGVDFSGVKAFDGKNRDVKDVWQEGTKQTVFSPGTHQITWVSYDGPGDDEGNPNGNKTELQQTIVVLPLIRFDQSMVFIDEDSGSSQDQVSICLNLNGTSPSYPVEVELLAKQVVEDSSVLEGLIDTNVLANEQEESTDSENTEANSNTESTSSEVVTKTITVVFNDGETQACTLVDFTEFALGINTEEATTTSASIKIVDGDRLSFLSEDTLGVIKNDALKKPALKLVSEQAGIKTRSLVNDQGFAKITLQLEGYDLSDVIISWEGTDSELVDIDDSVLVFEFDPSIVATGIYDIKVGVLDRNNSLNVPTMAELRIKILDSSFSESIEEDNDNDGIPDKDEVIPVEYMLSTESDGIKMIVPYGMSISLGDDAMVVGSLSPEITPDEFTAAYSGLIDDPELANRILSFNIRDLPLHGMQVPVVVKLNEALDEISGYYKLKDGEWVIFDQSNGDKLQSATSIEGICPDPGKKYSNGLRKGSDCIKLLITDGGPNDDDGLVNGVIKDPGGIGVAEAVSSVGDSNSRKKPSKMSGGTLGVYLFLVLVIIVFPKRKRLTLA